MNYCPCCKDILLPHVHTNGSYWFCRSCWQAMPVCSSKKSVLSTETITGELPTKLSPTKRTSHSMSYQRKNIRTYRHPLAS
jgi:DNA-directed RNA polymerase subunit M/transcription elongation factor TFIIS